MEQPRLIHVPSGQEFLLEPGEQTLGRGKSCDIYLPDSSLSKTHAWVVWRDRQLLVRDAGSRNGMFIGGDPVEEAVVQNGDVVCFGKVQLEVAGLPGPPKPGPILRLVGSETTVTGSETTGSETTGAETTDTNTTWPLGDETITIGSHRNNDIVIAGEGVSRYHAEISREGDAFSIQDLGARNGIVLRDAKIQFERLEPGDEFKLGTCVLRLEIQKPPTSEALREVLLALRRDPIGTFKNDRRVRLGAAIAIGTLVFGALLLPGGGDFVEIVTPKPQSRDWLKDGSKLLVAGNHSDARTVFRKAKVKLLNGDQKTAKVLEGVADMWDTLDRRGHERFRWSKAEDLLRRTDKLKKLPTNLRDWLAAKSTFVELNKGAAKVIDNAKDLARQAQDAGADRDVNHALELFKKASNRYAQVPAESLYSAGAQEQEHQLSTKAFEILRESIVRGTRSPRPEWHALQDRIGDARAFALTTEHRNALRSLYETCRINRNDEDLYTRAHELIGTEQPESYDRAERLLQTIDPRSRIHADAAAYLNWIAADRFVRSAKRAYDRADARTAFEHLQKASRIPNLGATARRSIIARRTHWSRVVRAYDRGMARGRTLNTASNTALEELSEVVRLETNPQNVYRIRANKELLHIRRQRLESVEGRLASGLAALREREFVKAKTAFDAVAKDSVRTQRHLRSIQQAVARVNAEDNLLGYSKRHMIRDHESRFPEIRDKLRLLASWLPRAHLDRAPAKKYLAALERRIRGWKVK